VSVQAAAFAANGTKCEVVKVTTRWTEKGTVLC